MVCFLTSLREEHGLRRRNRLGLKVKRREELEVDLRLKRRHCGGGGGGAHDKRNGEVEDKGRWWWLTAI